MRHVRESNCAPSSDGERNAILRLFGDDDPVRTGLAGAEALVWMDTRT
jgi:hypothetical protein